MHTAKLTFRFTRSRPPEDKAVEAINHLLDMLERSGQLIFGNSQPFVIDRRSILVFVSAPEANSIRSAHHNKHVRAALRALHEAGLQQPTVRDLGRDPGSLTACTCRRPSAYILHTDYLSSELPLRCGDCLGPVPFYRFPPTTEWRNYEDIIFWAHHYRGFDRIWIASGVGERLAYREISEFESELSREGLGLCKRIRRISKTATYYYLTRHYGRSDSAERKRRCPKCKGAWLLSKPWHGVFDFRCRRCHLVSNVGWLVRK